MTFFGRMASIKHERERYAMHTLPGFLPKRLPGISFPSLADLIEVYDMLAENLEAWTDQWKQAGLEQGREQGLEQGLEQGRTATRQLLVRLVRRRFGPEIAEQSALLLAGLSDLQQLEELGDQLLLSPDGAAWLSHLREADS